jgi:cation:H+ antiporter
MFINLVSFIAAFVAIWYGAGLIVKAADRFSRRLKLSSFALSFFVLGLLTSTPEFALGITAIAQKNPEIFVGNLIGGIPTIFFFIIPLLAILGNGINLHRQINTKNLLLSFTVMLAPTLLVIDQSVTLTEGLLLIALYFTLFLFIQREKGIFDTKKTEIMQFRFYSFLDILKVLLGVGIIFVASDIIVNNTLYFAKLFNISAFYISLIFLSLGTNLPELSLAVRSVIAGNKDIAFGDYVGSAAANTFLFGFFTVINVGEVLTVNSFFNTFVIMTFGLSLFFYFTKSKHDISRKEGFILLLLYIVFVFVEYA